MSAHYSKYDLNTYRNTPYFLNYLPKNYPLSGVMLKSRAFRRLPPNLRKLCELSKQWAIRNWDKPAGIAGIENWYDDDGYELDPLTKRRLTDKETDDIWDHIPLDKSINSFKVVDVPVPEGGFADPNTWMPAALEEDKHVDPDAPTVESLLGDIKSHGREYSARYYGVSKNELASAESDVALAKLIHSKMNAT